jgi:hypothetical protein
MRARFAAERSVLSDREGSFGVVLVFKRVQGESFRDSLGDVDEQESLLSINSPLWRLAYSSCAQSDARKADQRQNYR